MKQVTVHLRSIQQVDDVKETMTVTARGTYEYTPGHTVITYTEHTAEEGEVTTRLTVEQVGGQALVTMCRKGVFNNCLTIQRGVAHAAPYTMGPCEFMMETLGSVVDVQLKPREAKLKLCYTLTINGTPASKNTIQLQVQQ